MKYFILILLLFCSSTQLYSFDKELAFSLATKAFVFCYKNQGIWLVLLGCVGWINQYFANSGFDRDLIDIKSKIDLNAQGIADHRQETAEQAAIIRADIAELKEAIDLLDNKVDNRFDDQNEKIEQLTQEVHDLTTQVTRLLAVGSLTLKQCSSSKVNENKVENCDDFNKKPNGGFLATLFGAS